MAAGLASFVATAADTQVELERLIKDPERQTRFRARWAYLLENPEERNDVITLWYLDDGEASSAEEIGPEAAAILWDLVAELTELPYKEFLSIPVALRGTAWDEAQTIILAGTRRQAFIEEGWAREAMALGINSGRMLADDAQGMTANEIKTVAMDIPAAIKERQQATE